MSDSELNFRKAMGQRIAEKRKSMHMTQEQLGDMAGVTTQCVSHAESGNRTIRSDSLVKISTALGVSADYLLTGKVIDRDCQILVEKLIELSPEEFQYFYNMIDGWINLKKQSLNG